MKDAQAEGRRAPGAGAVAAGAVLAGAPAMARQLGQNDRIRIGCIGVGGRGWGVLGWARGVGERKEINAEIVAGCDIYEPRKDRLRKVLPDVYHDYRELLDRKDIDAVIIASPDHWHAPMTIAAMEAGKDVYCEKPMTRYWHEAKAVYYTARRTGRVFQIGAQGCSGEQWFRGRKVLEAGGPGQLLWTRTGAFRNSTCGQWDYYGINWDANPQTLDWDAFIGSARKLPFRRDRLERYFRWRKFWDYSGGIATDLFYHALSHNMIVLGGEMPARVVSDGSVFHHNRDVPDTHCVLADFPSGNVLVMPGCMVNDSSIGEATHGHYGTLHGGDLHQEAAFADRPKIGFEPEPRPDHMQNFLECIRSREEPACSGRVAYATMVVIALSIESYRTQRAMRFDPEKEELLNPASEEDYVR